MERPSCRRCGNFSEEKLEQDQGYICKPCFTLGTSCEVGKITFAGATLCVAISLSFVLAVAPIHGFFLGYVAVVSVILGCASIQVAFYAFHPVQLMRTNFYFGKQAAAITLVGLYFSWGILGHTVIGVPGGSFPGMAPSFLPVPLDSPLCVLFFFSLYACFGFFARAYLNLAHKACQQFAEVHQARSASYGSSDLGDFGTKEKG
ncbi:MAG: hypothetical protein P1V97_12405 [Planctomycetota bacterium]|nr:hypothetical protein [Planctomycetota bacterium]